MGLKLQFFSFKIDGLKKALLISGGCNLRACLALRRFSTFFVASPLIFELVGHLASSLAHMQNPQPTQFCLPFNTPEPFFQEHDQLMR